VALDLTGRKLYKKDILSHMQISTEGSSNGRDFFKNAILRPPMR
jgi:hypothetical protein